MPRLMPVTPMPRESMPTEALPGRPWPMLSSTVKDRRYGVSDRYVWVVLGREKASNSRWWRSLGCETPALSTAALWARLDEPLCR